MQGGRSTAPVTNQSNALVTLTVKIHPQMVQALLNIWARSQVISKEPFLGLGRQLSVFSVGSIVLGRISPLCVPESDESHKSVGAIRERVGTLVKRADLRPETLKASREKDPAVRDFLEVGRMVTFSDEARRSRDGGAWLKKNLLAMLESVEAHAAAVKKFGLRTGRVTATIGDARLPRAAGIKPASISWVLTSPPYSIALDYVKNDAHALEALGTDAGALRDTMTGVRGRGAKQKLDLYNEDMKEVFRQVAWALKPGGAAAFVIGDATVDGREFTTIETMATWAEAAGLVRERSIKKIVYGLYSVMIDERILIFRKPL